MKKGYIFFWEGDNVTYFQFCRKFVFFLNVYVFVSLHNFQPKIPSQFAHVLNSHPPLFLINITENKSLQTQEPKVKRCKFTNYQ